MRQAVVFIIILLLVKSCFAMSLDLDDVALPEALNMVGKFLGINMIISPKVKGNVSLHLSHLTPAEMLNTLLMSHDLIKRQSGNAWVIEPRSVLIHQHQEALDLQEIDSKINPLLTRIWQIHYAKAEDIAHVLQDTNSSLLTKRGHVRVDLRTNSLCIQESEKKLQDMSQVIRQLDIPVQQVLIEARLVSIDTEFERQLGLRFETQAGKSNETDKNLSENSLLPHYSLAVAKLADGALLDVKLSALENEGHGELISSPSLFTANQQTAYIESGEEIPYQETSRNGATSVTFKKAVLSLKVTPQVMPNHTVLLQLQVNQDKPSNHMVLGVPAINTRQISTNVLVRNGQTVVLGGIYEANKEEAYQRIPFLGKIPLLGLLFQYKNQNDDKRELLIFVTPRVVNDAGIKTQ